MGSTTSITIDTYRCSACMTCIEMYPHLFRLNELTEKAELINPAQPVTEEVLKAAAFCPEKCIEIE
ncbi:ferredoxin [Desulfogranum japonicum]|uniref:ferredoxin n=1 Tax=Desulfogranum japonicum TaxID=231447 RepID=UPI00040DEE41|nr:ferredoxin [Desulfogranum japonicum]